MPHVAALEVDMLASSSDTQQALLRVQTASATTTSEIHMRVKRNNDTGCFLWWSLPDVYDILSAPEHMNYSICRGKRWPTWCKLLQAMDFAGDDLLNSSISSQGPRCEFSWAAASTRAVIALLLQWQSPTKQTGRIHHLAESSAQLLEQLLSARLGEFTLAVSSGEDVQTTPSHIVGPSLIHFHVRDGVVDLLSAREAGPGSTHDHLPGVAGKASCSVVDLLRAAPCFHGKAASAHGFLPQLIWTLGPLVETSLLGLSFEFRRSSSDWVDQSSLTCVGKASGRNDVQSCLHVYVEENARMLRQAVDIGIAVDDGRMGRSPWKLGAFIIPGKNFAGWLAPQTHQEFLAPAVLLPDGDGFDIDVVDAAEQQAKKDEWLQAHDRRNAVPQQPLQKRARAHFRLQSKRFVVEVDNMLRCVPHDGPVLLRFQAPVDFQSILGDACLEWPCLVISADQGLTAIARRIGWRIRLMAGLI